MKYKNKITTVFILLISLSKIHSQSHNDFDFKFEEATKIYNDGNYYAALPMYVELYKMDTTNSNICYLVGDCYLNARGNKSKALPYLKKALLNVSNKYEIATSKERHSPLLTYKLLGDAYHIQSKFNKAIDAYIRYKNELLFYKIKDLENIKDANRKIEMCKIGIALVSTPINAKIENMGKSINSAYADYSPVLTADQTMMIFTTRRSQSTGGEIIENGKYFEDIYVSINDGKKWSEAQSIGKPINTNGNEASVGISPDGQEILIYKDDDGDGNIYSTSLIGDVWSEPIKLNSNINSKYWEPSAFISADGYSMYFTSDRPGGYGGRDIYVSKKDSRGNWDKATNMGALVNTEFDEDAPFIHPDGITLFFSSNGHNTMGGFDVFYSILSDNGIKWQKPVNIGYPINSPDDDIFYVVSTDKTKAYYSSFKEGGLGEKDNYIITFLDKKQAALTLLKGVIKNIDGAIPKNIIITVTDNTTGNIAGVYKPNSKTGQYLFILTPGKNYNISYEADGFLFYSENREISKKTNYYEIYKAIHLPPIMVGSKIVLNNIFFDFDKSTLRKTSNVELKNILKFINKHPNLKIEISGYTDSKGSPEYNLNLSNERALAVVNYLILNTISKERLVAKGYGETSPNALNQYANGIDNPEGRQLNRRVELKIIEIK